MSLLSISFSAYLVGPYPPPNPGRVYDAHDFIDAIKGNEINGYAHVPVRGVGQYLATANRDDAIEWFGQMVADYYEREFPERKIVLVPVPNKAAVLDTGVTPRTLLLAEAIQRDVGANAIVRDVLRWRRPLARAHEGGPRDFPTLYNALLMTDTVPEDRIIVLVDDMRTTGTHLQAASTEIYRVTEERPQIAFCAGRRVEVCPDDSFAIVEHEIDDVPIPDR